MRAISNRMPRYLSLLGGRAISPGRAPPDQRAGQDQKSMIYPTNVRFGSKAVIRPDVPKSASRQ